MRRFLFISCLLILAACATYAPSNNFFPTYKTMNFLRDDGIENFTLNEPVKIRGYIGASHEAKGLFASKKLYDSENLTCFEIKQSQFEKFKLQNNQEVTLAGKVRINTCSSEEIICLTVCQEYIFDIDEAYIINNK